MILAGNTLTLRIARRLVAISLLLVVLIGALSALAAFLEARRDTEEMMTRLTAAIATPLAQSIWLVDIPQTESQLKGLSGFPGVAHVVVDTFVGQHYHFDHNGPESHDDSYTLIRQPLEFEGRKIGTLEIAASRSALIRTVFHRLWQLLVAELIFLGLGAAVLYYFVNREASRPIAEIARQLRIYSPSETAAPPLSLTDGQTDELVELTQSFNRMHLTISGHMRHERELHVALAESRDRLAELASSRERTLNYLEGFGQLVLHLSSGFINLPPAQTIPEIKRAFNEIAGFARLDCIAVLSADDDGNPAIAACNCRSPQLAECPLCSAANGAFANWVRLRLNSRREEHHAALSQLQGEDARRHAPLRALGIEALLTVPLQVRERSHGLLLCATFGRERPWRIQETKLLELVAQIVASALTQRETLDDLARSRQKLETANIELDRLSRTDSMTELANRREFNDARQREMSRALRAGEQLSLALIDIDHFKAYNDALGHLEGDVCLTAFGALLRSICRRPTDIPFRLGGEEFALLLPCTDLAGARQRAAVMQQALADLGLRHPASPVAPVVTVSVGIAQFDPQRHPRFDDLYAEADAALYQAKHQGRNRIVLSSEVAAGIC